MEIKFEKDKLAQALLFVRNAIPTKEVEPILNMLYFKTLEDGQVQIASTDLDLMAVVCVKAEVITPGDVTVPGKKLLSLVSKLSGDHLVMKSEGNSIFISCGAYKGEFKTPGTEDYPEINKITQQEPLATFKREVILSGLNRIDFAVNEDEAKKQLMAVELSDKGMVASNGKVTALYRESFCQSKINISANCLRDLVAVMKASAAETVEVFEEDAYLVFRFDKDVFFTRKISVDFPDVYKRIDAPTAKNNQSLKFKVKDLMAVLRRVSLTASEETRSVVFTLLTDEEIQLSAEDNKDFHSEEVMKVTTKDIPLDEEKPFQVRFNYDLLLEILSKMAGEEIEITMQENLRIPCRIEEGKVTIFLMRSVI